MGRTSFPQHTSSIRTMDFSRDFGARRGKILSSHRVSTRWENHTMGVHKDLARKRGKARESKIYARENTKKFDFIFGGLALWVYRNYRIFSRGPFTFSIRTMHCRYRTIQYKDNVFSKRPILPAQIPQEFRGMDVWNPYHKYKQM